MTSATEPYWVQCPALGGAITLAWADGACSMCGGPDHPALDPTDEGTDL
ncbi:MAG: hypothetical protein FWH11_03390 [Micrococcales bacterium]|nr:hypothetical protein [Micrococcales bacterium]